MSQTTAAPKRSPRFPSEDAFYTRYSPHHEMPLSTVTSIAIHVLVIGLAIIGGLVLVKLNWNSEQPPVPVDTLAMAGGGGGHRQGVGPGSGDGVLSGPDAPDAPLLDPDQPFEVGDKPREQLQEARNSALKLPEFKDEVGQRLIEKGGPEVDKLLRMKSDLREKLNKSLAAGAGGGGSGRGGGEGTGTGTGSGGSTGPGTGGDPDQRAKRVLRWTLLFNTRDGHDYRNQLQDFGAILAIHDPKNPDSFLVIRKLSPAPVQPMPEDVTQLRNIYWYDTKPSSVHSLSAALGIAPPSEFIVFFPVDFEEKLLRLELGYRGKKESDLTETRFEIRRMGGRYEPVVISQR